MLLYFRIWLILFSIVFTFIGPFSYGSESSASHLKNKLNSEKYSDKDKMYFADSLILIYRKTNPAQAIIYTRKMLSLAKKIKDEGTIDYAIVHLGSLKRVLGEFDSSVYYYKIALKRYRKRNYEDGIASIYSNLANVYKLQSRYDLAIKNYLESIEVFKKSNNRNALGNAYSGLAGLYFKLDNIDKALEYWERSETEFAHGEPREHISHAYRGKARVYLQKNEIYKSYMELQKAFKSDSIINNDIFMSENLLLKMEWLLKFDVVENRYDNFRNTAARLFKIMHASDMPVTEMKYHELMGDFFAYNLNDPKKALLHYDSCLAVVISKEDTPEIRLNILRKQFQLKLTLSPASNLSIAFQILMQYEKEVSKIKNERITQETDARYSLKDKEEKIIMLNDRNATTEALIKKEKELSEQTRKQNIFLWSGISLFLIFIVYILFTNRKLKSTQADLQKSIEQKDFLFRELNHRVKNNLHIVSSFLSIESFGKPEEVQKILQTCENRIHSLGLVHEMLYKSEISEIIEVKTYFDKLVQVIQQTLIQDESEIKISIHPQLKLPSNQLVLVGLIANELITNSIKYARIPGKKLQIHLSISSTGEKTEMIVQDNGIGLDQTQINKDSIGMKLAKGLSRQLNGVFSHENLQEGVKFTLTF